MSYWEHTFSESKKARKEPKVKKQKSKWTWGVFECLAYTKSEARSIFKKRTMKPLPKGITIVRSATV